MSKNIFEFTIQFKDDPIFTNLQTVRTHLLYSLFSNFSEIHALVLSQNIQQYPQNAGNFFNLLTSVDSIKKFNEEQLTKIAATFMRSLQNSSFSTIVNKITDPLQCLIYFLKYFFIPVRLDFNTIPSNLQLQFTQTYLTAVVLSIVTRDVYQKYNELIQNMEIYNKCINRFLDEKKGLNTCDKAKSRLTFTVVDKYLNSRPDNSNPEQVFITNFNKLFIYSSIEVVKKFCPNYNVVKTANQKYDGSWLSPFDEDVNTQIKTLTQMI